MKKKSSVSPLIPLALLTALVGGVSTALVATSKNSKLKKGLQDAGDELVDIFDDMLTKIEQKTGAHPDPQLGSVSQTIMTFFEELNGLNDAAEDAPPAKPPARPVVQQIKAEVVKDVVMVEEKIEEKLPEVSEDISQKIAWLQRKGRNLAKKSLFQ